LGGDWSTTPFLHDIQHCGFRQRAEWSAGTACLVLARPVQAGEHTARVLVKIEPKAAPISSGRPFTFSSFLINPFLKAKAKRVFCCPQGRFLL